MNAHRIAVLLCLTLSGLLGPCLSARAQFQPLLNRIPEQANAILVMDVESLKSSRLGVKGKWREKHKENFLSGVGNIPPNVRQLVIGAKFNHRTMQDEWKIGVAQMSNDIVLAEIARREKGSLDKVGGESVVLSPRNAYFVRFAPKVGGMMRPADRKELARWLLFAKTSKDSALSPYLKSNISVVGKENQIVMAFDVEDLLEEGGVAMRLKNVQALAGEKVDYNQLAKIIAGLRGAVVSIQATDTLQGQLRLDFSSDVEPLARYAKPLFLEALDRMGAHIEDMQNWSVSTLGRQVVLSGNLTETGARQMLMPLLTPGTRMNNDAEASDQSSSIDPKASASLRYFKSLKTLLDDVQDEKVKTYKHMAALLNKYAQSIDELPILDVDELLLTYGSQVSQTLRGMTSLALSTKDVNNFLEANKTEGFYNYGGTAYGYGGYGWGGYGGTGWGYCPGGVGFASNYTELGNQQGVNEISERTVRGQVWNKINASTTQVRRAMTEKYKIEF
jgi:hypothetical protein